jgi:hypothetical protein
MLMLRRVMQIYDRNDHTLRWGTSALGIGMTFASLGRVLDQEVCMTRFWYY